MSESRDERSENVSIESGDTVYDDDGHVLGIVREFTDDGFDVEVVAAGPDVEARDAGADDAGGEGTGDERDDVEDIPGKDFGEGYLMWRCEECGAMGELEAGFPESCPDCYAPKEYIESVQED